jgi:hypothetical protein
MVEYFFVALTIGFISKRVVSPQTIYTVEAPPTD